MRIRSRKDNPYRTEQFQRIPVDDEFPVGVPDFNTRDEHPDIGPHIHDLLEIGYCFDGSGLFLIGDKIFTFKGGDAVVINTHEVHIARGSPGDTTSWGFLHLDPVRLLADNVGSYSDSLKLSQYCGAAFKNIIDGDEHPEITNCIRQILVEVRDRPKNYRAMVRSLTWRLMLLLNRYYNVNEAIDALQDYQDIERIVPALRFLNDNYSADVEARGAVLHERIEFPQAVSPRDGLRAAAVSAAAAAQRGLHAAEEFDHVDPRNRAALRLQQSVELQPAVQGALRGLPARLPQRQV